MDHEGFAISHATKPVPSCHLETHISPSFAVNFGDRPENDIIRQMWCWPIANGTGPHVYMFEDFPKKWLPNDWVDQVLSYLPEGFEVKHSTSGGFRECVHASKDSVSVLMETAGRYLWVSVGSTSLTMSKTVALSIRENLPHPVKTQDQNTLDVIGCHQSGSQVAKRKIVLPVPDWTSIARNYETDVAKQLSRLIKSHASLDGGRLVLWHGVTGTGKTNALKALMSHWRNWVDPLYIEDPMSAFSEPDYLANLTSMEALNDDRWRLLIAEDIDVFLRSDSRDRASTALSRLLNLTDGILGHGLRVIVLLTTNAEFTSLDPALTRPGRVLSSVEFVPLPVAQANAWLGGAATVDRPTTIAELFALKAGGMSQSSGHKSKQTVGFSPLTPISPLR